MAKKRHIVFARMPRENVVLIKEVTSARGEDVSDFVRRAIYKELARLGYLTEGERKALGLGPGNPGGSGP